MNRRKRLWEAFRFRFSHVSLNVKLSVMTVLSTFIPLLLCLFVLNYILSANATEATLKNMSSAVDIIHTTITSQTESIRKNALLILRDSNVRKLIQEMPLEDSATRQELKSQANNIIDIVEETDYITSVIIYVSDDYDIIDRKHYQPISAAQGSSWYKQLDSVPEKTMWISGDDFEGDNTSILPSSGQRSLSTLAYVTKIVNLSDYRRYEAVIRIDYSVSTLQDLLTNGLSLFSYSICLADSAGTPLLTAGTDENVFSNPAVLSTDSPDGTPYQYTDPESGQQYWKYRRRINASDWQLISASYPSPNPFSSYGTYASLIYVLVATWLLLFLASMLFFHSISSRIRRITDNMKAMREQQKPIPLPPTWTQDEITDLSDSYIHMARELQENMQWEYLLGASKRTSDLRALQAQINPHFLYNTLELIDYYAYEQQPEMVEKIVSKLAKFYKLSLNHGKDIYQLWQEIQLVNSYFDIQNIRYQNKITLYVDVPTEFDQCQIPPITLQPLIENAINHGIREKPEKAGAISLTAHRENDDLVLYLADDGVGMPPDLVDQLNKGVQRPATSREVGSHYGILNIDQRLKIMFGERYGLSFSSTLGQGTTVTIVIPI